jgi:TrmH family RNA methyltransferase
MHMEKTVTSSSNPVIKQIRALQTSKGRAEAGLFIAEGERFVEEALNCAASVRIVLVSEDYLDDPANARFVERLRKAMWELKYDLIIAPDAVVKGVSETETPQGVLAVAAIRAHPIGWAELVGLRRILVLDRIQDPGNLGTILRSADAFGFEAAVLLKGTVDAFNPKTLRSTMGSIFRVKLITAEGAAACAAQLKENGFLLIGTDPKGDIPTYEDKRMPLPEMVAIVIGNEANGISTELLEKCDRKVRIPMPGKAESLNAAIAAAIMMYEETRKTEART